MADEVNVLDILGSDGNAPLELVRLDGNETAVVFFTPHGKPVSIHFCDQPEINAYILCNGKDCVLCRVGKKKEERVLIPVYLPEMDTIGVLPVSQSLRPNALLPQLSLVLKAKKPMVAFIKREA